MAHSCNQFLNTVAFGNCIELMKQMPSRSVDFILTDPLYITRYLDRSGRSIINDDNADWLRPSFEQAYRVLIPAEGAPQNEMMAPPIME